MVKEIIEDPGNEYVFGVTLENMVLAFTNPYGIPREDLQKVRQAAYSFLQELSGNRQGPYYLFLADALTGEELVKIEPGSDVEKVVAALKKLPWSQNKRQVDFDLSDDIKSLNNLASQA